MDDTSALDDPSLLIDDTDRVLLAGPVDPSNVAHPRYVTAVALTAFGGEVPWRVLADGAQAAQPPVVAQGTSTERREAQVSCRPAHPASDGGALPPSADTKEDGR
jgi:hypothetical protein